MVYEVVVARTRLERYGPQETEYLSMGDFSDIESARARAQDLAGNHKFQSEIGIVDYAFYVRTLSHDAAPAA